MWTSGNVESKCRGPVAGCAEERGARRVSVAVVRKSREAGREPGIQGPAGHGRESVRAGREGTRTTRSRGGLRTHARLKQTLWPLCGVRTGQGAHTEGGKQLGSQSCHPDVGG